MSDLPRPDPGPGEVRLRIIAAGICSTDLHITAGHFAIRPPRVLGHELAGVVDAAGEGVPGRWIGQRCGVSPARFCGQCGPCRRGLPELCARFECLGNTHDGAFAEFTLVRADQLVPLDGMDDQTAVWLEPLACVLHALEAAEIATANNILIIGAGVLGRWMVQAIRATSKARVAVVDPNPTKISAALASGAETGWTVPRLGDSPEVHEQIRCWAPEGVEAVIDTTGRPEAIVRGFLWTSPGARLVLFGVFDPLARLRLSPGMIFDKELTLTATAGMTPASFQAAVDLLRSGKLNPSTLVAKTVGLEEVPQILTDPLSLKAGKVLVRP